jgi:hypothetical protein
LYLFYKWEVRKKCNGQLRIALEVELPERRERGNKRNGTR